MATPRDGIQDPADVEGKWAVATEGTTRTLQQSVVTGDISWIGGGHLDWSNQKVEAKIRFTSFTDSGAMILLASRFVDFDHYYFVYLKADGSMKIRKRISGSTTDLISSYKTGLSVTPGATHTIGMSIAGAMVTMYLDGVAVATAPDVGATLAAGGIALGAQKVAASFDDVLVTVR
jgi:hypothetical protein